MTAAALAPPSYGLTLFHEKLLKIRVKIAKIQKRQKDFQTAVRQLGVAAGPTRPATRAGRVRISPTRSNPQSDPQPADQQFFGYFLIF